MSSPQQFLYRIWLPGQTSDLEPTLTLNNEAALKFFVRAGVLLFPDTPFRMCAYHLAHELMERPVAEGTYQIHQEKGRHPEIYVVKESGIHAERSNYGLIATALKAACEREQEQAL